jgi:CBS domain containing-hemolysin-like protein
MKSRTPDPASGSAAAAAALAVAALAFAPAARASFLPPEMMDTAAMYIAWFVICIVPIGGIALFWLVHVLPEKIAHKRHHPQKDAIHTLCLLSLVFGGLLWPVAWLWAYTKPTAYRLAYGTEKHDDYYHEMGTRARAGELLEHDVAHLREELDAMDAKGTLTAELKLLRKDLVAAQAASAGNVAAQPVSASTVAAQAAPAGSAAKAGTV